MPGLLILAHAPLATSLLRVAAHVYPAEGRLEALDVSPLDSPDQVEASARALLARMGESQALILTDVYGATPCNVALRLADGAQVRVVAGVNVPMLWRVLCYRDEPLAKLVERAVAGGMQGVMQLVPSRPQSEGGRLTSHDQDPAHDQQ